MEKSAHSHLNSSGVSDKVMEYCIKYGKERDLEKFMRFHTSSTSDEHWVNERNVAEASCDAGTNDYLNESDNDKKNEEENKRQVSPKTPQSKKKTITDTKHTQTPDSASKSHRRLEWDSLGDVGYRKSKSASNISVVERILLHEFFEVSAGLVKNTNSSESDVRLLEQEIAEIGTLRKICTKPNPNNEGNNFCTLPLASSTHIEKTEKSNKTNIKPQVQTIGTNTPLLQKKIENYAQTSNTSTRMTSQEVQVSSSLPSMSPLLVSTAEPSSLEHHSKISSCSSETKTTQPLLKKSKSISSSDKLQPKLKGTNEENFPNTSEIKQIPLTKPADCRSSEDRIYKKKENTSCSTNSNEFPTTESSVRQTDQSELKEIHTTKESNGEQLTNRSELKSFQPSKQNISNIKAKNSVKKKQEIEEYSKQSDENNYIKSQVRTCSKDDEIEKNHIENEEINHNTKKQVEVKTSKLSNKRSKRSAAGDTQTKTKAINNDEEIEHKKDEENDENIEICERLKNMFITWNNVMEENKENLTSTSSSCTTESNPPQIDLGIQLICSIMKTKHIDNQQKKRLVRNIVKRITKIANSCELDDIVNNTASLIERNADKSTGNSVETAPIEQKDDRSSVQYLKSMKSQQNKNQHMSSDEAKACAISKFSLAKLPPSGTNNSRITRVQSRNPNQKIHISGGTTERKSSGSNKNLTEPLCHLKNLSSSTSSTLNLKLNPPEKTRKTTTNTEEVASSSSTSSEQTPSFDISLCVSKTESGGKLISAVIKQPETKITSNSVSSFPGPSFSKNTTKTKPKKVPRTTVSSANVEFTTENRAMQEWLNPMTQSEIEFQNKKMSHAPARDVGQGLCNVAASENFAGLNWIDEEIQRLQKLKQILLHEAASKSGPSKIVPPILQEDSVSSECDDKFYSSVFTKRSADGNRSTAGEVKKVVNERVDFREVIDQNIQTKGLKQFDIAQKQRSKIDTPNGTIGSESVDSFVRQRREEFLDHYKSQKLTRYDQILNQYNKGQNSSKTSATDTPCEGSGGDHYSLPFKLTNHNGPSEQQANCYPTSIAATMSKQALAKNSTNSHTQSSELSVPMGCYESTSTPTTSPQYDVVASEPHKLKNNIGSQTNRSMEKSRPTYETRFSMVPRSKYVGCPCLHVAKTVCIQTRPQGVSYTLHFPAKVVREKTSGNNNGDVTSKSNQYQTLDKKSAPCLQSALKHGHPEFIAQSKKRKSILNRIQKLRLERERELRGIADGYTSLSSLDRKLEELPPPVTEKLRIFPTKQMKAMTSRRVAKLPEVLAKLEVKRDERYKRSNRLLRDIFNRRLRERVRKGRLSFNHSSTLI